MVFAATALCFAAQTAAFEWQDPEPPGAQALAESVVKASFNSDKTTRLKMRISRLVDRISGIEGFASGLAPVDASLDDRLDALGAEVSETEVTIRLAGSILFDFDSDAIRADAARTLEEVVAIIQAYSGRPVGVEGHTDAIASESYNQELSERRARSVAEWFENHEVDSSRLKTRGFGESRPVADNSTAHGRQLNRRVEVVIETR
jgi:outer membrane protein OmpA-like peptidoglycan-associated protein